MSAKKQYKGLDPARAARMYARDKASGFGASYIPAIQVLQDAPSQSSPSLLFSHKLGRDLHLLSRGEFRAALHALHLPELVDLHEQKILQPLESPHPLMEHPLMSGNLLPNVPGTAPICKQLLCKHPSVMVKAPDDETMRGSVYYPYVGDLLLILTDANGLRCVNWSIKRSSKQFGLTDEAIDPQNTTALKQKQKARRRLEIERLYYAPIDVPTYPIAYDDFDPVVSRNLFVLMVLGEQAPPLDDLGWVELTAHLLRGIQQRRSINELAESWSIRHGLPFDAAYQLVHKALWERRVLVDLYRTILPDRALSPGARDVVAEIRGKWLGSM
jgi:hypothetical protein